MKEQKIGSKRQAWPFSRPHNDEASLNRNPRRKVRVVPHRPDMRPNAARSRSHPPMERSGRHAARLPEDPLLALATLRLTLRALAGTNRRLAEKSRRGLFPGRITTLIAFVWLRQTHDRPFPDLRHAGRRRHPDAAPHAQVSPLTILHNLLSGPPSVASAGRAAANFDPRGLDRSRGAGAAIIPAPQ